MRPLKASAGMAMERRYVPWQKKLQRPPIQPVFAPTGWRYEAVLTALRNLASELIHVVRLLRLGKLRDVSPEEIHRAC